MGKAVQDGMAQLMDGNGQVLTQGKIDQGMAKLSIPEGTDIIRINSENDALTQPFDHSCLMEDSSSDPFRNRHNIDLLSFYAENVKTLPGELDLPGIDIDQYDLRQVYMFTDRGMYQPGETAHIKGLVRNLRGNTIGMPTQENAVLSITGKDDQGNDFKSSTTYRVYGTGSSPWLYEEDSDLRLKTDKPLYKDGDTARIILPFPMEGNVGITLERGHVLRSMVVHVTLKDQYVEVPIKARDTPNIYASVFLVKGAVDRGRIAGTAHLLMGYCNLRVDPARHRLNVTCAQPRKIMLPGLEQEISGTVTDFKGKPVQDSSKPPLHRHRMSSSAGKNCRPILLPASPPMANPSARHSPSPARKQAASPSPVTGEPTSISKPKASPGKSTSPASQTKACALHVPMKYCKTIIHGRRPPSCTLETSYASL